jgi:hypothetical protein
MVDSAVSCFSPRFPWGFYQVREIRNEDYSIGVSSRNDVSARGIERMRQR